MMIDIAFRSIEPMFKSLPLVRAFPTPKAKIVVPFVMEARLHNLENL